MSPPTMSSGGDDGAEGCFLTMGGDGERDCDWECAAEGGVEALGESSSFTWVTEAGAEPSTSSSFIALIFCISGSISASKSPADMVEGCKDGPLGVEK